MNNKLNEREILLYNDLLSYGELLTDDSFELDYAWIRVQTFKYKNHVYYLKKFDNDVLGVRELF